jgi:hypothetical protein
MRVKVNNASKSKRHSNVKEIDRGLMRHGIDGFSPSSWEPQEEGMMSTAANFPSVRNQGMSNPGKSQTSEGDAC